MTQTVIHNLNNYHNNNLLWFGSENQKCHGEIETTFLSFIADELCRVEWRRMGTMGFQNAILPTSETTATEWNLMPPSEVYYHRVKSTATEWNLLPASEIYCHRVKSTATGWNLLPPAEIYCHRAKSTATEWNLLPPSETTTTEWQLNCIK